MISGTLKEIHLYRNLLRHSVWGTAFQALQALGPNTPLGKRCLGAKGFYVDVHSYETKKESECVWESHKAVIDLQFTISGEEFIDFSHVSFLGKPITYVATSDRFEYEDCRRSSRLHLLAGGWAIFFPVDAHRPMIRVSKSDVIKKAVVKIPIEQFHDHAEILMG